MTVSGFRRRKSPISTALFRSSIRRLTCASRSGRVFDRRDSGKRRLRRAASAALVGDLLTTSGAAGIEQDKGNVPALGAGIRRRLAPMTCGQRSSQHAAFRMQNNVCG